MDFRKEAKASRAKKLHQMTVSGPDAKVDSSDFKPYADPQMDKKTGKKPVNPRAYKRGGKVAALEGGKAGKRGDRMMAKGRKAKQVGGGSISAEDRAKMNAMVAEAAKEKPKQQAPKAANVPMPPRRPEAAPDFRAKEDIQSPYKKGGRTKKMMGGDITAGGNPQIPSSKGQTSLLRKAVGLDYKKGGRIAKGKGGGAGDDDSYFAGADKTAPESKITRALQEHGNTWKKINGVIHGIDPEGNVSDPIGNDVNKLKSWLGYKKGGRTKKMNGGPMMAGPTQTLMKRKTPMNNPAAKAPAVVPMRAKGGKVSHMEWEHSKEDLAQDKKLAKKHGMSLEKWEKSAADKKHDKQQSTKGLMCGGRTKKADGGGDGAGLLKYVGPKSDRPGRSLIDANKQRYSLNPGNKFPKDSNESFKKLYIDPMEEAENKKSGGRTQRASGGRAKGKSNINIVIAPQAAPAGGMPPMGMPPRPAMPLPPPPPAGGAPGGMPPGAMGGAPMSMPMPIPMPMGGGAPAPQGAGVPGLPGMAPLPRKSGGRVKSYQDMTAGAGSGEGRLQKTDMAEYKRHARKAGGKIPHEIEEAAERKKKVK